MEFVQNMPHLKSEDISAAVVYVLGTPPHVQVNHTEQLVIIVFKTFSCYQVHELTIKPVGERF